MSKKINPTSIGLFIVTGVALGLAGLLLFSSSKFFAKTHDLIAYFDDSLSGLSEGAPVKFRGVTVGSVKRVMVRYNQATNDYAMPVIIEIQEDLLKRRLGDESVEVFSERSLEDRIKGGLRASLESESLITGVLYIEIRPDPHASPPVYHQLTKVYHELPTEPTQIQRLFNNLARLDIKSIETNLNHLITKLDSTVGSLNMAQISQGVTNLLVSLDRLVTSPEITNGLASVRLTLDQYRLLAEKLNSRVDPLADSLTNSLAAADSALGQIRGAAQNIRTLIAPESPMRTDLDSVLQELSSATQSLATLLDFLKQHPNALITGRQLKDKKP